jgi:hypothetical protein
MRKRDGTPDEALLTLLRQPRVKTLGRIDLGGETAGTKERNDALARQGQSMAQGDAELTAHRANSRNYKLALWERGFDVGTAVSYRSSEFGPGQAVIRDSLKGLAQTTGYNTARDLQYRRTVALHQALDGLTRQVLSGRDSALSALGAGLGASSPPTVRAPRAAEAVLLAPLAPTVPAYGADSPDTAVPGYADT